MITIKLDNGREYRLRHIFNPGTRGEYARMLVDALVLVLGDDPEDFILSGSDGVGWVLYERVEEPQITVDKGFMGRYEKAVGERREDS